jgi:hypothetical protein
METTTIKKESRTGMELKFDYEKGIAYGNICNYAWNCSAIQKLMKEGYDEIFDGIKFIYVDVYDGMINFNEFYGYSSRYRISRTSIIEWIK